MTANEKTLVAFESHVRQMILRLQQLKAENADLAEQLRQTKEDLRAVSCKMEQQRSDYESLKMAKMMTITDGDLTDAKERLSRLIRDVNKCIAILSDDNQ